MGWNFRKSFKILPGIKLNFSKRGVSTTVGGRGASVNIGRQGTYLNTGIPGTGISNRTRLDSGQQNPSSQNTSSSPEPLPTSVNPTNWWKIGTILLLLCGLVILLIFGGLELRRQAAIKQEAQDQSFESKIEQFTYETTYYDVVKALGNPTAETSSLPPKAKIPNVMLYYKEKNYVIIIAYDTPKVKSDGFIKSNTHYLGTKALNPERVFHVSQEKFRTLIEAYRFTE